MNTKILVVDDEVIIAVGIEKKLKVMSYGTVYLACSGEEAVEKALQFRPDIILMDINLGKGIDGIETASRIHKHISVPIIYLTAHSDEATIERAKITEPFGFILKPYQDSDLRTAIEIGLYKHKMERQLRENEQRLASTLGSIGDGVISLDARGQISYMNPLAQQLTGWDLADAQNRDVTEVFRIIDETHRKTVENPALQAMKTHENVTLADNTILIRKNGDECFVDDSAAPIRDINGQIDGAVLVFRDITERRRLQDHLRQAQKMESIGRLAGGIAHDFNNIMMIIVGYGELLKSEILSPSEHLAAVDHICDAGNRAATLTQQIMAFSRKQMLVSSVLNLNTIVRDMTSMIKRILGENIELVTQVATDLGLVKVDPTQIGQVLLNLASYARHSMPHGGKFVVSTRNSEIDGNIHRLYPDVIPGRYVLMTVSDNGLGMSKKSMDQIFEPFFTTKELGQGSGLGLASVYGIIKQSQGHIEATSELGMGTTFRIFLPLVDDSIQVNENLNPSTNNSETILLVDDEEIIRKMTRIILKQQGYTVIEASNGMEAMSIAKQYSGTIHLLLTDLIMPQMSGRELAEKLTAIRPEIRVLFMSGYTEDELVQQEVDAGSIGFLHKPFSLKVLINRIQNELKKS